jgi:antiviral helicase SKI2
LSRLSEEDRQLGQIRVLTEQLKRGIGTHHAGLLPILKEVVEILFYQGLIRVLFATDTFAMGVNAPARTVTFWFLNKPDASLANEPGKMSLRPLLPQEYVQMAGRAGRRGLDTFGTVIVVAHENQQSFPSESQLRNLMTGRHAKLESKFRLEYRCASLCVVDRSGCAM